VVSAETGIGCDKEVSEVGGIGDVTRNGMYGVNETSHLFDCIGEKDGFEIVSIFQSMTNAGHDGIDIFEDGRVFDTDDVVGKSVLEVMVCEDGRKGFGSSRIGTGYGEAGEAFKGNFFGVAGAADNGNVFAWHAVTFGEVFGNGYVDIGDNPFDGREDILGSKGNTHPVEMLVEIRRRDGKEDGIGMADDLINIGIEGDFIEVEIDTGHVGGIMAYLAELGNKFRPAHVPIEVFLCGKHNLSQSGSPTTTSHDGYFSGEGVHNCGRICGKRRTS
jgi:hypothetical protein